MADRIEKLRERMKAEGVDLVALAPGAHMGWLLDVHPHADERAVLACITTEHAVFLMPALEAESALERLLQETGGASARRIVLDECMRADHAALVQDALPEAERIFAGTTVGALRMRKDDREYRLLKQNARVADKAMQSAWNAMKPGMTETEVAAIIRESFTEQGATPLFSIVGTGRNGAFPHHHTGDTVLQPGDAVVMDIGGGMGGYSSDMTRMAVIDTPPDGYAGIHVVVEAAVQAALAAARPGAKAHEVDDAARRVITAAGYGDNFVHWPRHGGGDPRAALDHRHLADRAGGGNGVFHRAGDLPSRPVRAAAGGHRDPARGRAGDPV